MADPSPAESIGDLLDLTEIGSDTFLAPPTSKTDPRGVYGGTLTALALRAATYTVPTDRTVHSLHGYFLKAGDATAAITLTVHRERDGGRYSTRRISAIQNGEIMFELAASFQAEQGGPDFQQYQMPAAEEPETLPRFRLDKRMLDLDARVPSDVENFHRWPTRLWIRVTKPLGAESNLQACALAFLSDMCTGLSKAPLVEKVGILPSLDHSMWIHRQPKVSEWMLMDLVPESTSGGRGMYTGRIFGQDGVQIASLAQESLFQIRSKTKR